ncbi:UBN1 protein, partial [Polypterus senegalus]
MGRKRSFDLAFKLRAVTYAKEHSGEEAAQHFEVDPKRIREWRKQMTDIEKTAAEKGAGSKRLPGGGAKKVSEELDELVLTWIIEQRLKGARVSRKMVRTKAKRIFDTEIDDASKGKETLVASSGWLEKFMKRHHLSLRRKTSLAQMDPEQVIDKLVSFVMWVANPRTADGVKDSEIIGMDETSAWFDMPGSTTVEPTGNRSVTLKTSGDFLSGTLTALTSVRKRNELKKYKMPTAVIPGGCTKYVQPADVVWNKPLKDKLRELYDNWMAGEKDKGFTAGGNLKAPALRLLDPFVKLERKIIPLMNTSVTQSGSTLMQGACASPLTSVGSFISATTVVPNTSSTTNPHSFNMDDSLDEDLIHNPPSLEAVSEELAALNSAARGSPDFNFPLVPKSMSEVKPILKPTEETKNLTNSILATSAIIASTPSSSQSPLNLLAEQALALGQLSQDRQPENHSAPLLVGFKGLLNQPSSKNLSENHQAKHKNLGLQRTSQAISPVQSQSLRPFHQTDVAQKNFPSPQQFNINKLQNSQTKASKLLQQCATLQQAKNAKTQTFHGSAASLPNNVQAAVSAPKILTSQSSSVLYTSKHSSVGSSNQSYKTTFSLSSLSKPTIPSSSLIHSASSNQTSLSSGLLTSRKPPSPSQSASLQSQTSTVQKSSVSQKLTLVAPPGGINGESTAGTQGVARLLTSSLKPVAVSSCSTSSQAASSLKNTTGTSVLSSSPSLSLLSPSFTTTGQKLAPGTLGILPGIVPMHTFSFPVISFGSDSSAATGTKDAIVTGPAPGTFHHGLTHRIKVIGGVKELTGEEYGVYVKRILPGGLASVDGHLQPGDQILEVNGESLIGVTSDRAVDILRSASATNHMRLLVARDEEARREFAELLEKYGSSGSAGSSRNSPIQQSGTGRYLESSSSGSSSRSQSPLLLSPANSHCAFNGNNGSILRSARYQEHHTPLSSDLTTPPCSPSPSTDFTGRVTRDMNVTAKDTRKPRHLDSSLSLSSALIRASIDSVKITASSAKSRSVILSSPDAPQPLDPTTLPNAQSIQALNREGAEPTPDEPQNQLGKTQRSCLHSAQHSQYQCTGQP